MAAHPADTRTRRYDPVETRQRILSAANMLFSTKGFVSTGTLEIARAADVAEGSVFYHFGSKKALLIELGHTYGENMVRAMQQGEDLATLTVETMIRRCFDYSATHKSWENIMTGGAVRPRKAKEAGLRHPEAEPFYRASREVCVAWTEAHMRSHLDAVGRCDVNTPIASSLVYAAVSDALDHAFGGPITIEQRDAIMKETIRFVSIACGYA